MDNNNNQQQQTGLIQCTLEGGLKEHFQDLTHELFDENRFKYAIPLEYLLKTSDVLKNNPRIILCMICQNIPHKDSAYFCSTCRRPICKQCYDEVFIPHEDSQQFPMPCQCDYSHKLLMQEHFDMFRQDYNSLKFKCFIAPLECQKMLKYDQICNPIRHIKDCEHIMYRCIYCKVVVSKLNIIKHRYECKEAPKKCRICGCNVRLFRLHDHYKYAHPEADNQHNQQHNANTRNVQSINNPENFDRDVQHIRQEQEEEKVSNYRLSGFPNTQQQQ
eukprot:403333544